MMDCRFCGSPMVKPESTPMPSALGSSTCPKCGHEHIVVDGLGILLYHDRTCCDKVSTPPSRWR